MAGKRHHHLPAFLLRRFAERSGKREGLVWRLDKGSGQPRAVNPKREAALRHYYSLELPDGTKDTRPEDVIEAVENKTARALHAIARGETPSDEDRAWLALFVARTRIGLRKRMLANIRDSRPDPFDTVAVDQKPLPRADHRTPDPRAPG